MKLSSFLHFAGFGIKTVLFRKKEPILGTVIVTDKCNLKCKHCSVNNITAVVHPYEQIRREMQQLYDMGIRILFFCGGETFLWRDGERTLRDLVVEAKEMGFLIVNVWSREAPPCHITMVGSHHPLREPDLHLSMYPALLSFGQQLLTGCGLQHGIFCTQPAFYAVLQSLQPPMPACP